MVTVVLIGLGAAAAFLVGFWFFWMLGSRVAGGDGSVLRLPLPGWPGGETVEAALPPRWDSALELPVVDLPAFRDLSYVPVKGIYLSSWAAGSAKVLGAQLELVDTTEINAMVIDVKDATGYISYDSAVPLADELKLEERRIKDIAGLLATLRRHGIVPIARIVCFKDPLLATRKPELAVRNRNGGLWRDFKGSAYTNPYDRRVWEYLVDVAEDAADRGFREIQFDYVRFPSDGKISEAVYPGADGPMEDAIAGFLAYARGRLEKRGVWVSADVFGLTVYVKDDLGIGQKIEKVARNVDIVSPMIYPSHYEAGSYGQKNPNARPYEIITAAVRDSGRRLAGTGAMLRPWLQDFSLGGITYGVNEVRAQIKAVEEQGYKEWLLWDPGVTYTRGALRPQ
ncbi:MAG: putative glycoside hydrolase [Thermoleophilia bacterium]